LVCPVVGHSQVPWTWEAQPLVATGAAARTELLNR